MYQRGAHYSSYPSRPLLPIRAAVLGGLLALLVIGIAVERKVAQVLFTKHSAITATEESVLVPAYREKVMNETDVRKLLHTGDTLMAKNMPLYAAMNYERASALDPNFRDAAYGWAYALLQARNAGMKGVELGTIKGAVERAEAVDPLYLPILEIKKSIAGLEHDQSTIEATQARIEALQRNSR